MARGRPLLEILRRHPPDPRELLRERPFAPHRGPLVLRPHRGYAAVLGGGGGFAVARRTILSEIVADVTPSERDISSRSSPQSGRSTRSRLRCRDISPPWPKPTASCPLR